MQRAIFVGVLISIVCPIISFYVVNRSLGFIGVGITHAAFGGMALGSFLGINPVWVSVLFSAGAAIGIARVSKIKRVSEDTAIGVMYAAAMAIGIILIGLKKSYTVDLFGYLFGNILAVTKGDIIGIAFMAVVVIVSIVVFFKEFLILCFDEEFGRTLKLPMDFLYNFLLLLIAVTVVMAMKVIGIILVSALLILPAATAQLWFKNYRAVLIASVIFSLINVMSGLFLSYYLNIASGATIVLIGTILFLVSGILKGKRKTITISNSMK